MDFDEAFLIEAAAQTPSSALPKLGLDFMHGESDLSNADTANEVTHSVPICRNPLIKKKIISDGQNLTHQISEFIHKVWTMVEDDEYSDFIGWTDSGDSIYLSTDRNTSEAVLPNFFKHKKLSSFVRQLNLYGFTKNTDLFDPSEDTLYFSHPNFIKNCPDLLTKITRKKSQFPQAESENQYHSQNSSEKRSNSILQANTKDNSNISTLYKRIVHSLPTASNSNNISVQNNENLDINNSCNSCHTLSYQLVQLSEGQKMILDQLRQLNHQNNQLALEVQLTKNQISLHSKIFSQLFDSYTKHVENKSHEEVSGSQKTVSCNSPLKSDFQSLFDKNFGSNTLKTLDPIVALDQEPELNSSNLMYSSYNAPYQIDSDNTEKKRTQSVINNDSDLPVPYKKHFKSDSASFSEISSPLLSEKEDVSKIDYLFDMIGNSEMKKYSP